MFQTSFQLIYCS